MFELKLCNECIQMTNHLNGICQKCNVKDPNIPLEKEKKIIKAINDMSSDEPIL